MTFLEFLSGVPVFSDFTQDEIHLLEQTMMVKDYPQGQVFAKEGKTGNSLHLVVEGEVVITRESKEHGIDILQRLAPGDLFGLVSLVDQGPRSASCTAATHTKVASLPRSAFELLYKSHDRLGYHFQHMIARQLVHDSRAYSQALKSSILAYDRNKFYEALQPREQYRGTERRGNDRRRGERRTGYRPRIF